MKPILIALLVTLPAGAQAQDVGRGQGLYLDHCASCHGRNLEGEQDWQRRKPDGSLPAPPHDETGHTWHHGDRFLFAYTKFGGAAVLAAQGIAGVESRMPAFGGILDDADIGAILDYIRSTWPEAARAVQAERSAAEGG